jgi:cold shock CspA family protein
MTYIPRETESNYNDVKWVLAGACQWVELPTLDDSAGTAETQLAWQGLWSAVATWLLQQLDAGHLSDFESAFPTIHDAVSLCGPAGRQAAVAALFGEFTRRAIGCGVDRTRFRDWFGPDALFTAPQGRMRGRVLYLNDAKGRGKVLGPDRVVYFVHFSMIRATGFCSLEAGQLVEFTPQFSTVNGRPCWVASEAVSIPETGAAEPDTRAG